MSRCEVHHTGLRCQLEAGHAARRCVNGRMSWETEDGYVPSVPPLRRPVDRGKSLTEILAAAGPISLAPEPLNLPSNARHQARVERTRGRLTITCSCGNFRHRTADRHDAETAWGAHRGTS